MIVGRCVTVKPLQPYEVENLRILIRQWCAEYGCIPQGKLAQDRARKLIMAYEAGVRDPKRLFDFIRPF